jgi:hypothetical protein
MYSDIVNFVIVVFSFLSQYAVPSFLSLTTLNHNMKLYTTSTILAFIASINLVRSITICDNYTAILFTVNNSTNQLSLITAVVNLAVLGDSKLNVPGVLAAQGGLAPIFAGAGPTTNEGGTRATVNFLDGGINQKTLLEHLYQFFGSVIGCTAAGFPAYAGVVSMFEVHRFMDIDKTENDYFISQVGAAASALGVSSADVAAIAGVLGSKFNTRCAKPITAEDGLPAFLIGSLPSVCTVETCPLDADPDAECANVEGGNEGGFFARLFARIRSFFSNIFG